VHKKERVTPRKTAGHKREKVHRKELRNLYCSQDIIQMIKRKRMRWAGNVARMEDRSNVCKVFVGNLKEDCLEDLATDGRIILNKY
jgi:hypothetical protein